MTRLDARASVGQLLDEVRRQPLRGNLTAQLWEQGATLRVVRQAPSSSRGHKQPAMRHAPH